MKNKIEPQNPFLIYFYGYPGSGKSAFASQFVKELQNTVVVSAEDIAKDIKKIAPGNNTVAKEVVKYLTQNYIENGINVILDTSLNKKSERRSIKNLALKNKMKSLMIWIQIDSDSSFARERVKIKKEINQPYTRTQFDSVINNMQNPENEEFIVISGKHTYKSQRTAVLNKMYNSKIISQEEIIKKIAKPELVNLVPKTLSGRGDFGRNITIR